MTKLGFPKQKLLLDFLEATKIAASPGVSKCLASASRYTLPPSHAQIFYC